MKTIFMLAALVCASLTFGQTRYDVTITVDSVVRRFIVERPPGTPPSGGYPVVFMLHGTGQTGEELYQYSGWRAKGEEENFLTVFPFSLEYCVEEGAQQETTTKWNNGDLQSKACPGQLFKDDVTFIRSIVDTIAKALPIDPTRIYASGFSNGGAMTSKLLVEMSDVFAAIAAHAGSLHPLDSGAAQQMIPFLYSIGTGDNQSFNYDLPFFPFGDSMLTIHRGLINRYLSVLGLGHDYTKDSLGVILRYRFNTKAVAAAWEFDYVLMQGLEHEYPKSGSYPVGAADMLWSFFRQFTLPLSVKNSAKEIQPIYLRPNPTTNYLIVDEDATLTLYSPTGAKVMTTTVLQGERLALPALGSGVYIATIETKHAIKSAKVVVE